jgi:hypothetical protein
MLAAGRRAGGFTSGGGRPLGLAGLPALLAPLRPQLDRLLAGDLFAALPLRGRLPLEQGRLAGDQLAAGELKGLGEALPTDGMEVQHLAAVVKRAVQKKAAGAVVPAGRGPRPPQRQ